MKSQRTHISVGMKRDIRTDTTNQARERYRSVMKSNVSGRVGRQSLLETDNG